MAHPAPVGMHAKGRMDAACAQVKDVMAQLASVKKESAFVTRDAVQPSHRPLAHVHVS